MHTLTKPDYRENCASCSIKASLFKHLSRDEQAVVNKDFFVMHFKAGELIYKQGGEYTHVISLSSGLVKLYIEESNKNVVTRFIRPIDFIGGPGMYVDNKHHNTASAVEDVTLCYFNLDNFKSIIRKNGLFAEELIKSISSKGLDSFDRMRSMTVKQMPGLVAEAILHFSDYVYKANAFNLTITRQDIADFCGLTKESVIRTFKDFKEEGLIHLDGNYMKVIDLPALQRISKTG